MSRSGYVEDYGCDEPWRANLYRGRVTRSIEGKRGQRFLRELLATLDAMPEKRLTAKSFQPETGEVCTLGCIAKARGVDTSEIDERLRASYEDDDGDDDVAEPIAELLDIATPLAREVMYENDEGSWVCETPEARYQRMRRWVVRHIKEQL